MWWYRDSSASPTAAAKPRARRRARGAAPAGPADRAALAQVAGALLRGRTRDPDAWLVMSLLVDTRIEFDDGTVSAGMTWLDAERAIAEGLGSREPLRLYNRFAKEFGNGYSLREDLPPEHAALLRELRAALENAPGVA